jgi:hypothetical protein
VRISERHSTIAVRSSVIAVVGAFDPLSDAHFDLFHQISIAGTNAGLTPLVIILFPAPATFVNAGYDGCFAYSALEARLALIREFGNVHALVVRMTKTDIDASCKDFVDLLNTRVDLRELWLGPNQSLGRGRQGSYDAIAALAKSRAISLRRLDGQLGLLAGRGALNLASQGKLKDAITATGHPPIWGRPRGERLQLPWPPGRYLALPIAQPSFNLRVTREPIPIEIHRISPVRRYFEWPSREIRWLLFAKGPADEDQSTSTLLSDLRSDLVTYKVDAPAVVGTVQPM